MLSKERIEELKASFYGWEYCVQNKVQPTMTHEEIELLMNLFIDVEDYRNKELREKSTRLEELKQYKVQLEGEQRWSSVLNKVNDELTKERNQLRGSLYIADENAKFTEMKLEKIRVFHSSYHMDKPEATRQSTLNLVVESYYSNYFREIEEANHVEGS